MRSYRSWYTHELIQTEYILLTQMDLVNLYQQELIDHISHVLVVVPHHHR